LCKPASVAASAAVVLEGKLYVNGGTVYAGPTAGNSLGIFQASTGTANAPELQIASGTLYVYGAFTSILNANTDKGIFNMSGGTLYMAQTSSSISNLPVFCIRNVVGSSFTMSGGDVYFPKPASTTTYADFDISGASITNAVTGGTLHFGNATTAYTYRIGTRLATVNPNIKLEGIAGTIVKPINVLATSGFSCLSMYISTGNTLDLYDDGNASHDMTITSAYSGTNAFYVDGTFQPRLSTVTFSRAGSQTVLGTASPTPFYSLTINSGTTLIGSSNMRVQADWTNNGTYTQGTGTLRFNGPSADAGAATTQNIGGTTSTVFYNLIVNKASGVLNLNTSTTVGDNGGGTTTGVLTLTSGQLVLNSKTLTISNPAITAIAYTSGSIKSETASASPGGGTGPAGTGYGIVTWKVNSNAGAHIIPFITGSAVSIPFTFNVDGAGGSLGDFSVSTYGTTAANTPYPASVNHVSDTLGLSGNNSAYTVDRFWYISKTGGAGKANLTFSYSPSEAPSAGNLGSDGKGNIAQKWGAANYWLRMPSQTYNTALTYSVTVSNITQFAPSGTAAGGTAWGLAQNIHPLPIELLSFSAKLNSQKTVDINWSTASEINNNYFVVERSVNGISFEPIASQSGSLNSFTIKKYSVNDENPLKSRSYYRLKQVDFGGKFTYSASVSIFNDQTSLISIYPNPARNRFSVKYNSSEGKAANFYLIDQTGKIIMTRSITGQEQEADFDITGVPAGNYFLSSPLISGGNQRIQIVR
jgi:hypothetical protein